MKIALSTSNSMKVFKKIFKGINGPDVLFWLMVIAVYLVAGSRHLLDSDEGVILNGAWNLINGRLLYVDFFEYIPPLSFYIVYFFWKIFGISYWVAKFSGLLALLAATLGISKISSHFQENKYLAKLPPLLFALSALSWSYINHNTYSLALIVWSVYFFAKALDSKKFFDWTSSGFLAGLAIITLQQKGLVILFALAIFLAIECFIRQRVDMKAFFIFCATSILPPLALLLFWPANLLYKNLLLYPLYYYPESNMVGFELLSFAVLGVLALFFVLRKKIAKIHSDKIGLLFWVQICLLAQTIPRSDFSHVLSVLFPAYILFAYAIGQMHNLRLFARILTTAWGASVLALIIIPTMLNFSEYPPRSGIGSWQALEIIRKECSGSPEIFAGPFLPGFYFETRKFSATPYTQIHLLSVDQLAEALSKLSQKKPACAALNYQMVEKFNYHKNNIDNFVADEYTLIYKEGAFEIHELKKPYRSSEN